MTFSAAVRLIRNKFPAAAICGNDTITRAYADDGHGRELAVISHEMGWLSHCALRFGIEQKSPAT